MIGIRTFVASLVLLLPVALVVPRGQDANMLDMVDVGAGLSVMRHEVSVGLWHRCVEDGGCTYQPPLDFSDQNYSYPVTDIGALDAAEFVAWAQAHISSDLRLPTLEEWHSFSEVQPLRPTKIFTDPRLAWAADYGSETKVDPTLRPSGGFGSNSKGIADLKGNVWEWTSSCVVKAGANRCPAYFAAGIHDAKIPVFVRNPESGGCSAGTPPAHVGLRLVRKIK